MSLPPVVPLRDALIVLAVLVVLAITSNLCLFAFLSTQATFLRSPFHEKATLSQSLWGAAERLPFVSRRGRGPERSC